MRGRRGLQCLPLEAKLLDNKASLRLRSTTVSET